MFWKIRQLSSLARGEVSSIFSRLKVTYQEVKELADRRKLPSFTTNNLGRGSLVLEHAVGDLPFLFEAWGRTRFLFLKVGGAPLFFLERLLSSFF